MSATLERLKILINSSTPIVVMETVEEMRAVGLARAASAELNMAVFEWSIADGLVRAGTGTPVAPNISGHTRVDSRAGGGGLRVIGWQMLWFRHWEVMPLQPLNLPSTTPASPYRLWPTWSP